MSKTQNFKIGNREYFFNNGSLVSVSATGKQNLEEFSVFSFSYTCEGKKLKMTKEENSLAMDLYHESQEKTWQKQEKQKVPMDSQVERCEDCGSGDGDYCECQNRKINPKSRFSYEESEESLAGMGY